MRKAACWRWLALWPLAATAGEPVHLDIDFDRADPPFAQQASNGQPAGFYPALLTEVFLRMKLPVALNGKSRDDALTDVEHCRAGAIGANKTVQRKYDYSAAIIELNMAVYANATHPFRFASLRDLAGKTVGIRRGWHISPEFQRALTSRRLRVAEADSDEENFARLQQNRLDAVVTLDLVGDGQLAGGVYPDVEKLPQRLDSHIGHLLFCKKAGLAALLRQFDKTLADMHGDGSYDSIVTQQLR